VIKDQQVDGVIVLLTPQSMTEIELTAQAIIKAKESSSKPIIAGFMGSELVNPGIKLLKQAGVVTTNFPEPAAKAMAAFGKFTQQLEVKPNQAINFIDVDKNSVQQIFAQAKQNGQTTFPEAQALAVLEAYKFPLLKTARATSAAEAASQIQQLGGEFAMKIVSPDILHKSDVGGVMLHLNAENVAAKYEEMMTTVHQRQPNAKLEGVLLMEMAPANGLELILGIKKVAGLGTLIMFGLGGIYVEVFKDVNFAFAPMTQQDVTQMVNSLKSSALFEGVRGQAPIDKEKLIESISRLSQLVTDFPEIVELDINPLLALPQGQGVKVLDSRIVIE
jgi:acetyltransferase